MITLEFRIQTLFDGPCDVSTASATDIHYNFMLGDVTFSVGDSDFSAHWGWIPVLDFALSLKSLCQNIGNSGHERFEFTEPGEWIDFVLRGNSVDLASSYVDSTATVELKDLTSAAVGLGNRSGGESCFQDNGSCPRSRGCDRYSCIRARPRYFIRTSKATGRPVRWLCISEPDWPEPCQQDRRHQEP